MIPQSDLWNHIQHLDIDADEDDFLDCAVTAYMRNFEIYEDESSEAVVGFEKSLLEVMDGDDAELGRRYRLLWKRHCEGMVKRNRETIVDECRRLFREHYEAAHVDHQIRQAKERVA